MDELKRLFDALSSRGYYTKSFDEFKVKFQDPAYQEKVFGVVSRDKLYTKTKDEFFAKYVAPTQAPVIDKKKEDTVSTSVVGSLESQTKPNENNQGWLLNTVSSLDKGFYQNLIGNPIKGLGTLLEYGTSKLPGGGTGKGPISDALINFGNYFNKTIDELTPQDEEFKGSLTDQFGQAFGQVASIALTAGAGGAGGAGGGGAGTMTGNATSGTANTGSGGGGAGTNVDNTVNGNGGSGGSGVVILRMPTASYSGTTTGSPTVSTSGSDTILVVKTLFKVPPSILFPFLDNVILFVAKVPA